MVDNFQEIILDWHRRIDLSQKAHYLAADRFNKYSIGIGLPSIILSAVAGATFLTEQTDPTVKIVAGLIALLSAVFSALLLYLNHSKLSEQHRAAASDLGEIRRKLFTFIQFPPASPKDQEKALADINDQISKVDDTAPLIPADILIKANKASDSNSLLNRTPLKSPILLPDILLRQVKLPSLEKLTGASASLLKKASPRRK